MDEDIKTTTEDGQPENGDEKTVASADGQTPDPQSALQEKLAATHDRLLRTAAELDNFRKRARRDVDDAQNRGRSDVLAEILPVIDSVELALSSTEESMTPAIVEGLQMIKRQFFSAVERFGVKPVESKGKSFDPNVHEAVAQVHSDNHPAGQIVEEMRKGYLLNDRLLRAAMVVVSKGAPPPATDTLPPLEDGVATDTNNGGVTVTLIKEV